MNEGGDRLVVATPGKGRGPQSSESNRKPAKEKICKQCGKEGHALNNCPVMNNLTDVLRPGTPVARRSNRDVDSKITTKGGRGTPVKSNSPSPIHYGIVVSVKETFGFIRGFGMEDDLFFPFEGQDARIGEEVSFSIRERAGRPMATQVTFLPNGSFLQKVGNLGRLSPLEENEFQQCEVVFVGLNSGVLRLMNDGKVVVFNPETTGISSSEIQPDTIFSCVVDQNSATGIYMARSPFYGSRHGMQLGKIVKLPEKSTPGIVELIKDDGKQVQLPRASINTRGPEIKVGDIVWLELRRDARQNMSFATNITLCTPLGETPFFNQNESVEQLDGENRTSSDLKSWLEQKDDASKRITGVIISLKDTFAFVKMDRDATVFLPYSELCTPTADFTRSSLKVQSLVTFEIKKSTNAKESDVAMRVFVPPNASRIDQSRTGKKKQTEVILKEKVEGRVTEVSDNGSIRMVEYEATVALESTELWNELIAMIPGEMKSLSDWGLGYRILAPTYCRWINDLKDDRMLKFDEKNNELKCTIHGTGETKVERMDDNGESKPVSRNTTKTVLHAIPCSTTGTDSRTFKLGENVVFDLYIRIPSGRRVGYIGPLLEESRPVLLNTGEVEMGVVVHGGMIVSNRRLQPVFISEKSVARVGDAVKFVVIQDRRHGLVATNVEVVKEVNTSELGLEPMYHGDEKGRLRLKGTVSRQMAKIVQSGGRDLPEPTSAVVLRSSGLAQMPSGWIIVGKEPILTETEEETSENVATDWRRENELLRTVRGCKDRSGEEPLHVFKNLSKNELQVLEKEIKKLGLISKFKPSLNQLAVGKRKEALTEWATKLGRIVTVESRGVGEIIDCRWQEDSVVMLTVKLQGSTPGDESAIVQCEDSPSNVTYVQERSRKSGSGPQESETGEEIERVTNSLRAWAQKGVRPPEAIEMQTPSRAIFRLSPILSHCLLQECLMFKEDPAQEQVTVSCDTTGNSMLTRDELLASSFVGQFAFLFTGETTSTSLFPVEGDTVEFTVCRSTRTGILRATDIRLIKAKSDRIVGVVEEYNNKGGWLRPQGQGKLSAEFTASDVLSRFISVGDVVDFKLSEKGDKASKIRVLQSAPPVQNASVGAKSDVSTPAAKDQPPAERPRINQELIANAPTATSAAASKIAQGPDGTIGFTKERWRNKRLLSTLNVDAPEFKPVFAEFATEPMNVQSLLAGIRVDPTGSPGPRSSTPPVSSKFRPNAAPFIPPTRPSSHPSS